MTKELKLSDEEKLGLAIKLNEDFAKHNEYVDWAGRLIPNKAKTST